MPVAAAQTTCTPIVDNIQIWQAWNYAHATTSASTGTTYIPYSIMTSANTATWTTWNQTYSSTGATTAIFASQEPAWAAWNTAYEETAEQKAERERLAAEASQRAAAARAEREAANARAKELLLSLLSDEQARTYIEHGWFEVRGSKGGRWRIRNRGQHGNVDLMPEIGDERDMSFCAAPAGGLPDADAHLAQMLHLVTDEDGFRKIANVAYTRPAARAA